MRCGAFHRVEGTLCLVRHGQAALSGSKTKAPGFAGGYLLAHKALPVSNLQEFIDYAKANQSKMQYGSGGPGSATHLACVLLNAAIGVDVTHVPYRSAAIAIQDLIA